MNSSTSIGQFQFLLLLLALPTHFVEGLRGEESGRTDLKMFNPVQVENMERQIKAIVLEATKPCKELHQHLTESPNSLNWIAKTGSESMLKLAISLDDIFNPNILSLLFRRE